MQPFNRLVEQPLCLARRILAIKNITRHDQQVYFPFSDNSNQLVEYSGLLVLARITAQCLPDMPVPRVQYTNHCSIAPLPPTALSEALRKSLAKRRPQDRTMRRKTAVFSHTIAISLLRVTSPSTSPLAPAAYTTSMQARLNIVFLDVRQTYLR
jgi:hypothetical protein